MNSAHTKSSSSSRHPLIVSTLLLLLLVTVVGIISVSLLNSTWFKSFVEDTLTETIGQEVTIESLSVDLGNVIDVLIKDIAVKNSPWASAPHLATVEEVVLSIDVVELLGGDVVLTQVRLAKPVVHLEQSADGKTNWSVATTGDASLVNHQVPGSQSEKEDAGIGLPRVESLDIEEGTLTYHDLRHKTALELSFHSNHPDTSSDSRGLFVEGNGHLAGESLAMELSVASRAAAEPERGSTSYPLTFHLDSRGTTLLVEGEVDALISPETVDVQVSLEGQNLSRWEKAFGIALPRLPTYELTGRLTLLDDVWSIEHMNAKVADSDVTGALRIMQDADQPRFKGDFFSDRLNLAQLQKFMPQPQNPDPLEVQAAGYMGLLANAEWQGQIQYSVDGVQTESLSIENAKMALKLDDTTLTVESLSGTLAGAQVSLEGLVSVEDDDAEGRIRLLVEMAQGSNVVPAADTGSSEINDRMDVTGNFTGELTVNFEANRLPVKDGKPVSDDNDDLTQFVKLRTIVLQNFNVHYDDSSSHTKIDARLHENMSEKGVVIKADGEYHDEPIALSLTMPVLESLIPLSSQDSFQRLALDLKLTDATVSATASVMPTWPPTEMHLRFLVESAKPATTAALLGVDLPTLGEFIMSGSLAKRNNIWELTKFESQIGESSMAGEAIVDTTDELRFQAVLKSKMLDVTAFVPNEGSDKDSSESSRVNAQQSESNPSESHPVKPSSPWLTTLNGKMSLDVQQMVLPGATLKDVFVQASVDEGLLDIAPLSISLGGGTIKTKVSLNLNALVPAGSLRTDIQRVDLDQALTALGHDAPKLGTVDGHIVMKLPNKTQCGPNNSNVDALLDCLRIEEVGLKYHDPDLQAKTDLRLTTDSFKSDMRIKGKVEYQGIPVDVSVTTGSLHQSIENYQELLVDATLKIRETTIGIEGKVGNLVPLESLTTSLRLAGPDLFRFGEAINIPLPHLPPYDLRANWQRKPRDNGRQVSTFENLEGTIGDSDVAGQLRVTTGGERPIIFTRLQSRKLDLDDLAGLTGAPPDPEETASAKQKAKAEKFEDRDRVLPKKPMDFTKLQNVDADVEYRAKRVQAPDLPIDDFILNMTLKNGHMKLNRLDFGVANGTVAMELEVNARESPVRAKLKGDFDQVNLSKLLASYEMAEDSFGNIGGRATLWMQGESMANWFASADGGLYLTMTGGKMDALLVELAGLDFTESATVFLGTDTGISIDCAYADLQARSGIVTIKPFIFDTKDTKFKGHGKINLRQEQMNLTVEPYPKDFTLLSSRGPLNITGTFKNPSFGVDPSFPSPEFGTADDSQRCTGMIEDLRKARKDQMDERKINFERSNDA